MPTPSHYSSSGPRITVNSFIKDPLLIRARMLRMAEQQFIMEALLRQVPGTDSGVIGYEESTPQFTDDDAAVVAEGAEIPLTMGQDGIPKAAFTIKTALGIEITQETKDRNRVDKLDQRMKQVRNTIVRHWERRLFTAFNAAVPAGNTISLESVLAARNWYTGSAPTIRDDLLSLIQLVSEAEVPNQDDSFLGFVPDTLVVSTRTKYAMLKDDAFAEIYKNSPVVTESPVYTGQLPKDIYGLTIMASRFMDDNTAYVLERKTAGGYSDERPFQVSPTRRDDDREVWRSNAVRRSAIFVDQPFALAKIIGIKTDPTP